MPLEWPEHHTTKVGGVDDGDDDDDDDSSFVWRTVTDFVHPYGQYFASLVLNGERNSTNDLGCSPAVTWTRDESEDCW